MVRGLPAETGFTATFGMATVFLTACAAVALLVPVPAPPARLGGATAGS
jgi:hypothetical protein